MAFTGLGDASWRAYMGLGDDEREAKQTLDPLDPLRQRIRSDIQWFNALGNPFVRDLVRQEGDTLYFTRRPLPETAEQVAAKAVQAERTRILAALEAIKPMEQPYTRLQWSWEQKGAKDHHAKVLAAIQSTTTKE